MSSTGSISSCSVSNNSKEAFKTVPLQESNSRTREIQPVVEGDASGVENVIRAVESGRSSIGPLAQPYDAHRTYSHPAIDSSYRDGDQWKYPIDEQTQLRLVEFVEGDKINPLNYSKARKTFLSGFLGVVCFTVSMNSAMITADISGPAETFHVSTEVIILSVSLMISGFGVGPMIFSPLSEEVGRNFIYFPTLFIAVVFIVPSALAQNIGTFLVCRFIDGVAFSAPMTLIGGSLSDMWEAQERGMAMAVFSASVYLGPVVAPLVGGFVGEAKGWRWIFWVLLIWSGFVYLVMVCVVPETHHGTLLKRRAAKLRKITGDSSYRAVVELKKRSSREVVVDTLGRPFILLFEPIVFAVTLYMSINYGLLYMFFFAYPIVYGEGKGWDDSHIGLMFIPIAVGILIALLLSPYVNKDYNRRAAKYRDRGELPPPEIRLIPMMWGCFALPIGLFCFAWTSFPSVHWAGPCISGLACGFGFLMVYIPSNNYIVDSYQHYAASTLASKTLVRSFWGAGVCLFTNQMYHRLGYEWATSLMAFISLACTLIPFAFYRFGRRIRMRSKYAYSPELADDIRTNLENKDDAATA